MANTDTLIVNGFVRPRAYQMYQDLINSKQAMEPISITNPGPICGFNRFEIDPSNRDITFLGGFSNNPDSSTFNQLRVYASGQPPHWGVPTIMVVDDIGHPLRDDIYGEVPNAIIMPSGKLYILKENLRDPIYWDLHPLPTPISNEIAIYGLVAREKNLDLQKESPTDFTIQLGAFKISGNVEFQLNELYSVICPVNLIRNSESYRYKYASNMSGIAGFLNTTGQGDTIDALNPVTDIICGYYIYLPNNVSLETIRTQFPDFGLAERFNLDSEFRNWVQNGLELLIPFIPYGGNYFYTPQFTKAMFKGAEKAIEHDQDSNIRLNLGSPYDYDFREMGFISPNQSESVNSYEQRAKTASQENPTVLTLFDDDYTP